MFDHLHRRVPSSVASTLAGSLELRFPAAVVHSQLYKRLMQSVNASNEHDRNDRADKRTRRTDWINAPHTCWGQGIHTYSLALRRADGEGEMERGMCHVQRLQYKMKLDKL